jgi:antirestriction protein ArdC
MNDLYQKVTDRIVAALEAGTPPWIAPWRDGMGIPGNLATAKPYRGINVLMLHLEAQEHAYDDNRWLTLRQANELGARVRKGEQGTSIVFFRWKEIEDAETQTSEDARKRVVPLLRSYTVFNASQVEFLPERYTLGSAPCWAPLAHADEVILEAGAIVRHGGNRAFYVPTEDIIQMPPSAWFADADGYYATALHELTHWSGHPSRLNRPLGRRHGLDAYAYEELIAEMGAAFLCAHCGLPGRLEHASYIDSWLAAFKHDKRLIFVAAGTAQKAVDFVLGVPHSEPAPATMPAVA